MASATKQTMTMQPIVTFIGFITLGIILAVYVNTNEGLRLPIILISFLLGLLIAAAEIRVMVKKTSEKTNQEDTKISREEKVARYVAELFNEDIPFDEEEKYSTSDSEEL
ncbi:MAG: hypothetical protein ACW99A_01140 [Candidatus Kariarchaeaceae archaeon]